MEYVGSANPPLAVDHLHAGRHRQLRRHGTRGTSRLGRSTAPLLPLFLLLFTGLYMFVLPYAAKWRSEATGDATNSHEESDDHEEEQERLDGSKRSETLPPG